MIIILARVRMIPKKPPNTQYYWVLLILVPNTNTDTRQIRGLSPRATTLLKLDTGSKVHYCTHCVNVMNVM